MLFYFVGVQHMNCFMCAGIRIGVAKLLRAKRGSFVTESLHSDKDWKIIINVVIYLYCGVGLVVECLPSKQETRVRFSYAAQKKKIGTSCSVFLFLCGRSRLSVNSGFTSNSIGMLGYFVIYSFSFHKLYKVIHYRLNYYV